MYIFIAVMGAVLAFMAYMNHHTLDNIKAKNVGNGQHGNARFATPKELNKTYHFLNYEPQNWRKGIDRPTIQGTILGYRETPRLLRLVPDIKKAR
jgi:type IV secretion system protein VirD4